VLLCRPGLLPSTQKFSPTEVAVKRALQVSCAVAVGALSQRSISPLAAKPPMDPLIEAIAAFAPIFGQNRFAGQEFAVRVQQDDGRLANSRISSTR
jgi:hypothetical protein